LRPSFNILVTPLLFDTAGRTVGFLVNFPIISEQWTSRSTVISS